MKGSLLQAWTGNRTGPILSQATSWKWLSAWIITARMAGRRGCSKFPCISRRIWFDSRCQLLWKSHVLGPKTWISDHSIDHAAFETKTRSPRPTFDSSFRHWRWNKSCWMSWIWNLPGDVARSSPGWDFRAKLRNSPSVAPSRNSLDPASIRLSSATSGMKLTKLMKQGRDKVSPRLQ